MAKERFVKKSVSLPKSMLKMIDKKLATEYPPRTPSRYFQDVIARDLREAGILGNGQRKPELAHV